MSFILLGILNSQVTATAAGSYDLLETVNISGSSTASVTFSGLGSYSDYKHLQIRASVSTQQLTMQFNSDSAENYYRHYLQGDSSSVSSTGDSSIWINLTGLETTVPSPLIGDLLDFSNGNKFKTWRSLQGNTRTNFPKIVLQSGLWRSTSAITSIYLLSNTNLVSGDRISLYGIK